MSKAITELSLSEHLKYKLRDLINEYADHMSTGACKNYPDYQRMVGVVEGLALAERELLDYIKKNLER
tara:strand:- start:33 stop:236 length:204 start_codon:yes stop_codon:yes gene_type:complete